ncbi:PrgI family protein [Sphaerisporangium sp. NPDC049003]|uniref:PrgI family protein n=1 Tax=Sphaerisporangium sp. NPDC049003 TaxID=3364517 RepID=UPI0037175D2A
MSWTEVVRIPADVEQPDKIVWGFTARQVVILTVTGGVLYLGYATFGERISLATYGAISLPVAVLGLLLAIGTHDGTSLDRFVLAAIRYQHSPKHLVTTTEDIPAPPPWVAARSCRLPSPLKLPARSFAEDGLLDLGPDGVAAIAQVSTVSFALRTPEEQDGLVAVFARWLNSLSGPVQILVRAERVDLSETITALHDSAQRLPHPALAYAAREHAAFLSDLASRHELLRRQVLLVIREPALGANGRATAAARAYRRLDEAARLLGACGITVRLLDAAAVTALLASCFDPTAPPLPADDLAGTDEVISAGGRR